MNFSDQVDFETNAKELEFKISENFKPDEWV